MTEIRSALRAQLFEESRAMVHFSLMRGLVLPDAVLPVLEAEARAAAAPEGVEAPPPAVEALARAHAQLGRLVAPATPVGVRYLAVAERGGAALGNTPMTRRLMVVALVALTGLVLTAASPVVEGSPRAGSLTESSGLPLVLNQLFFLCAATLGAAFYGLFLAQRYITAGTFEPFHEPSYWVRIVLGMISGLLLASLVDVGVDDPMRGLSRPILALLGGFSASLVHRILTRLVETIEALVEGPRRRPAPRRQPAGSARGPGLHVARDDA